MTHFFSSFLNPFFHWQPSQRNSQKRYACGGEDEVRGVWARGTEEDAGILNGQKTNLRFQADRLPPVTRRAALAAAATAAAVEAAEADALPGEMSCAASAALPPVGGEIRPAVIVEQVWRP